MFRPSDEGLAYPLQFRKIYGKHVICDATGRELFKIDVIRPSIESWEWLQEWGQAICEKFNGSKIVGKIEDVVDDESLGRCLQNGRNGNGHSESKSVEQVIVKRGRGRPRKNAS